jgi:transcriptional regulator with XRE-family HTH domain
MSTSFLHHEGYALKPAQFDWIHQMASGDTAFFTTLGRRVAQLRQDRAMTQQQLADTLGIAQQTLANYETGRSRLPASMLPTLADLFRVPVDVLLGHADQRAKKRGPMPKWQQQIETIAQLPKPKQRLVTQMLDALLQQAAN